MDNKETASIKIQAKHDIIKHEYLRQYIIDKNELEIRAKILSDKVVITHVAIGAVLPDEILKFIKGFLFTEGSKVQQELIRIEKSINYKLKSLMVDRIDELLIYQDIDWNF